MSYRSIFRPDLFADQTIIVTGGGSGIGRCTAHELASLGAHPVLLGRKLDKLERVMAEIADDGGQASCHALDIRDEASVRETIEAILGERARQGLTALEPDLFDLLAAGRLAQHSNGWYLLGHDRVNPSERRD